MQRPRTSQFLAYALILTLVGSVTSLAIPTFQPSYASHKNISVEIDHDIDEPYEQSDDVVISGSIDEVEDDEDHVTIKVKKPGSTGTTWTTDKTLTADLDDDGNFDDSYAISSSAIDGVYAVEVDYNGENVYSYFIVDEDDDAIAVETDETSYQDGDEVTVSGEVDEVVSGEEDVEITIVDPTNDNIVDAEDVTLGEGSLGSREFEFSFDDFDSDEHGRYAVIVNYDNEDQQGFTLFEVEDPDAGGSDNISADMSDDAYAPGNTVSLSGTIDDPDSSTDLEIVIRDPGNHVVSAYGDDNVDVASNGDFDYDFDLNDDAAEGKYTVTLTYGSDDLKLDFTVDEDAGSTSTKLTVKLNKTSFLAGESITVTGTVPKIVNDEDVNVLAYDKDSVFTGSAAYVTPSSDKTYTATLKLKSDLKVQDGYQVRVDYDGEEVKATFSVTGQLTGSDVLTVKTDKPKYDVGSTVKITGQVASGSVVSGMKVLLQVFNPDDAAYRIDPVDVASDGSFSYSMTVGGDLGVPGAYEVKATYNGKQVKTTFDLGSSATAYSLKIAGKTYQIQYGISSGSITGMFAETENNKLVVNIDAKEDGQLTLVLPREIIDARTGSDGKSGSDAKFVIAAEGSTGPTDDVNISESSTNSNTRTVVIDYKTGTNRIEISGTSIVPEFGAISAIVLAIAIVGIIMATARFGNKFNFMRQ